MIFLSNNDLIYINEAAKALKATKFMYISNMIVSLNDIRYCMSRIYLDTSRLDSVLYNRGLIFSQKSLAKYLKYNLMQSGINIDETQPSSEFMVAVENGVHIMTVVNDPTYARTIMNTIARLHSMNPLYSQEVDVTESVSGLASITMSGGAIYYKHNHGFNKYYITLTPNILPMNKSDKVHLSIYDTKDRGIFYAKFRLVKKKFTIFSTIACINTL